MGNSLETWLLDLCSFLEPSCVTKYILLSYTVANKGASQVSQCLRQQEAGFDHWVRKIPWGRKWQPTPGFLPGEFHVQRSLVGYSLWGYKRVRHGWATENTHTQSHTYSQLTVVLYLLWCQKTNSNVCVLINRGEIFMRIYLTGMMDALSIWVGYLGSFYAVYKAKLDLFLWVKLSY